MLLMRAAILKRLDRLVAEMAKMGVEVFHLLHRTVLNAFLTTASDRG